MMRPEWNWPAEIKRTADPLWPDACPCGGDVTIDGVEDLSPGRCLSCGRAHRLRVDDRPGHSPWVEVVP
jgi:hypothetical protein